MSKISHCTLTISGIQFVVYTMDIDALYREAKLLGRETEHSLLFGVEIKNAWRHTTTSSLQLYDMVLN
jgi:hypothetical protein